MSRGNSPGGVVVTGPQIQGGVLVYSHLSAALQALLAGNANKLINGNFDFWQRGTSLAAAGYLADRWNTFAGGTGVAFTQARGQFPVGESAISLTPAKYYYFNTITNGGDATNGVVVVTQKIEGVDTLRGKVTVSFGAAVSAGQKIAVNIFQNFGTGGSPSAVVFGTAQQVSPAGAFGSNRYSLTFDLPSTAGKTLGTNGDDNIEVAFYFSGGTAFNARTANLGIQTGTFYLAAVQVEAGSVATQFEPRPIGTELALCQRYYGKGFYSIVTAATGAGQVFRQVIGFGADMRVAPTVTLTSTFTSSMNPATVTSQTQTRMFGVQSDSTGAGGAAESTGNWTASAEL